MNSQQENIDEDALGDICDPCPEDNKDDEDNDGFCKGTSLADQMLNQLLVLGTMSDAVYSELKSLVPLEKKSNDNCPTITNSGQEDSNGDKIGDACAATTDNNQGIKSTLIETDVPQEGQYKNAAEEYQADYDSKELRHEKALEKLRDFLSQKYGSQNLSGSVSYIPDLQINLSVNSIFIGIIMFIEKDSDVQQTFLTLVDPAEKNTRNSWNSKIFDEYESLEKVFEDFAEEIDKIISPQGNQS